MYRVRINQLLKKLVAKEGTTVTPAKIQAYYTAHMSQFGTPATRDLRLDPHQHRRDGERRQGRAQLGSELERGGHEVFGRHRDQEEGRPAHRGGQGPGGAGARHRRLLRAEGQSSSVRSRARSATTSSRWWRSRLPPSRRWPRRRRSSASCSRARASRPRRRRSTARSRRPGSRRRPAARVRDGGLQGLQGARRPPPVPRRRRHGATGAAGATGATGASGAATGAAQQTVTASTATATASSSTK